MSKYRIEINYASVRRYFPMLPVLSAWFAIVGMPWTVWTWIDPFVATLLLSMLTLVVFIRASYRNTFQNTVILIQDNGKISWRQTLCEQLQKSDKGIEGILSPSSKLTYWGLYLNVKLSGETGPSTAKQWVLKSECSEANYRRLARIILAAQRKTNNGAI